MNTIVHKKIFFIIVLLPHLMFCSEKASSDAQGAHAHVTLLKHTAEVKEAKKSAPYKRISCSTERGICCSIVFATAIVAGVAGAYLRDIGCRPC